MYRQSLLICGFVLVSGCAYHVAEQTDRTITEMARKSFDPEPQAPANVSQVRPINPGSAAGPPDKANPAALPGKDLLTVGLLEAEPLAAPLKLTVPSELPGSEVPPIPSAKTPEEMQKAVLKIFPPLSPLPEAPKTEPGPDGKPYTLSQLQEIAALNSPTLKQAASDVKAAEGALIQARTYPNPTIAYGWSPSNDGSTAGVPGVTVAQTINVGGKMSAQVAAAQMNLKNAELALKRARSDLATQVRTAYFGLLAAKETVRVNRALSVLTDEIYRAQIESFKGAIAAAYEPATLRAQAYSARLALAQSITSYYFAWKQVVAAIGLRQLPLSEVAGRVDSYIPYFNYDRVAAYVFSNHTDILTARNGIDVARYNLKLAQITPFSDVNFQVYAGKETSLPPFQWVGAGQVQITLPVWNRNKGGIISAEAALVRAIEQPHTAELNLTNNLQNAFTNYKNNLDGLEYYRRHILPDQVMAYRGVLARRQLDASAQFGDLVQAQQTLATNVSSYLTILAGVWTAAVQVADFLQTDDMFKLADPQAVPALPDMSQLMPLPCCHPDTDGASQSAAQTPCAGPGWETLPALKTQPNQPAGPANAPK